MITGTISTYEIGVDLVAEWKIENFFNLPETNGALCWSSDFLFGGERWYLRIYPNGSSGSDSSGHVDLWLWKYYSGRSIKQTFSLSLKTAKGEKYNEQHGTKDFEKGSDYHPFNRFIQRSYLTRRRYELVPDGVLTVVCTMKSSTSAGSASNTASASASDKCCHCKITFNADSLSSHQKKCIHRPVKCPDCLEVVVLQTLFDEHECQQQRPEDGVKELSTAELNKADTPEVTGSVEASGCATKTKKTVSSINQPEENDWVTDFSDFLKEGKGVDVTFELETPSGKTEFMVHQLILALRSPYFADTFYGAERNNGHLRISFKGIDPKAFEQMIRYCYDCKPCLRTTEDACALLKVAFDFKVMNLQTQCRTFIKDAKIDPKNVFSVLEVSEQIEDKSLGDMCYTILQEKTRESMAAYELRDVTPAMVHNILYLQILSLSSEYELIKWIIDWAKVMSEDGDSTSENAREYLERLLKDMNFLALTMEEFALLCKENPQFFSSDEIAGIFLNIAYPGTREMPGWYDNDVKCRVYTGSKE